MVRRNRRWPVLRSYRREFLTRIAMPLGGIGTGTVSLGGRGNLLDWEIRNRPNKTGETAENYGLRDYGAPSLFLVCARRLGEARVLRAVEGVLRPPYEGSHGCQAAFHGLPRFRRCTFHAAYPLAQVCLEDEDVPLRLRLEAFNPLVPGNADDSGLPVAVLRFVLGNPGDTPVEATVCGSLCNLTAGAERSNRFREGDGMRGLFLAAEGGDVLAREFGSMCLLTTAEDVSCKPVWPAESWRRPLLHLLDDLAEDGRLDGVPGTQNAASLFGSLAASVVVPPGSETPITFLITWHFPNRYNWAPREIETPAGKRLDPEDRIGNYYTTRFADAWDVGRRVIPDLARLESDTLRFVRAFCGSDLPAVVKEAALCNASTLRTETCFRTPDGTLYGWEGCSPTSGCCSGTCTHVWNYETTTPFLFGDLARSMREVEFLHATHPETGAMSFRVQLPLDRERGQGKAAADGQMGCILKAYREWRLSGDTAWLRGLWPGIRRALEFAWVPGGWDADGDGVMEGCQHNTMDVEYYGPNPQMQGWYLGALRAAEEMALAAGDADFAATCRRRFEQGSRWTDENLFNGEYYEHEIRPPGSAAAIHPATRLSMGAGDLARPDLQLGAGCLVDQLVGQVVAHVCGLGYLLRRDHVQTTLRSILRFNFREDLHAHVNHMRTFALNDEAALLMATYPRGGRPTSPFPYFSEVMTGFEYAAATHMLYEGDVEAGLRVIAAIRARYDGQRRNPFNEAECGNHYARAMAAWTAVPALSGFRWDGVDRHLGFARVPGNWFWSNGRAWGTCRIRADRGRIRARLLVLYGQLELRTLALGPSGRIEWPRGKRVEQGSRLEVVCGGGDA
ncbi:MAG: hypothetical protein JXR77_02515 [Lentisphaeria bacterium]|nr:hypothetical protein [Lentisphaeria bacterium]